MTVAEAPLDTQYLLAIYWAVTTMTTVGYGDIKPSNTVRTVTCHVSCVTCHVSCVTCRVSRVVCHVSCCHVSCVVCRVSCVVCRVSCVVCRVSCVVSRAQDCDEIQKMKRSCNLCVLMQMRDTVAYLDACGPKALLCVLIFVETIIT